ncbi:MAG: GHKL domain-containing protein [Bacteroidetes bacterium]|nr:GHKL domain-containing protein [Bacteroidota bacterium]
MRRLLRSVRLGTIFRIMLILALGMGAFVVAAQTPYWLISIWMVVLLIILVIEFIRFHDRSVRVLRDFLHFLRNEDSVSVSTIDEGNQEFQEAYEFVSRKFRNLRIEKETNYQYLKRIIEHVDTALICLKDEHTVELINRAATDLLQINEISTLGNLDRVSSELAAVIGRIQSGEREMIRFIRHGRIMKLSVRATEFTLDGQLYKIVSLHDIKSELEEQELDSWHKLVRVLTHEIMNSAIPISNMLSMARQILLDENGVPRRIHGLDREQSADLEESLQTAESRSRGLASFVQRTKSLSRIPEPTFQDLPVKQLFKRLRKIFEPELEKSGIVLESKLEPEDLVIKADPDLIEQVMINLLRNAVDALKDCDNETILISAGRSLDRCIIIRVTDNGRGIPKENLDQVFVPFFSTKKEGSGIGLSLSMQIMKLHKGSIEVQSEEAKGTTISLKF